MWADPNIEPKRSNRWVVTFGNGVGDDNGLQEWTLQEAAKPKWKVNEAKVCFVNHTFYYPGRVEWEPISIKLIDPIEPNHSTTILRMITASGYQIPNGDYTRAIGAPYVTSLSKAQSVAAFGDTFAIIQMDWDGSAIDQWVLINPWIQEVNFGDLKYDSDDVMQIEMKIRFDFARYEDVINDFIGP